MNSRAGTDGLGRKSSANRFVEEELVVRTRAGERMLELESRNPVISAAAGLAGSRDAETGCHLERIRHYRKIPAEYPARSEPAPGGDPFFIENIIPATQPSTIQSGSAPRPLFC